MNVGARADSSRRISRRACLGAVALLLIAISGRPAFAQNPQLTSGQYREYAIKATFLYHFSRYIEWPADDFAAKGKPFVIGTFRANPFGGLLLKIASRKKVDGRPIEIRQISSPSEALDCQILFIPSSVPVSEQTELMNLTKGHPVLVVGETSDFIQRGGNVQFYVEGNRVRFAFSDTASRRDDLKVSPKLLSLATIVSAK